jgi:hypothetical protein
MLCVKSGSSSLPLSERSQSPAGRRKPQAKEREFALGGATGCHGNGLIRSWLDQVSASVRAGLRQLALNLETAGADLRSCALFDQPKPLPPLERILTSHPLLHAAQGQMSREALSRAAEAEGLPVIHVAPERAASEAVVGAVARIGRIAGPPWAADQRRAAAAAWAAQC